MYVTISTYNSSEVAPTHVFMSISIDKSVTCVEYQDHSSNSVISNKKLCTGTCCLLLNS
jgi:hypothetical protein